MTDVLRRGRASLAFSFFAQGATFALLVTRIPAIQDRYGVSDALLPAFLAAVPILAGVGSVTTEQLVKRIRPSRLLRCAQAIRLGVSIEEIHAVCKIDPWFLRQLQAIVESESEVRRLGLPDSGGPLRRLKAQGFSDARLGALAGKSGKDVQPLVAVLDDGDLAAAFDLRQLGRSGVGGDVNGGLTDHDPALGRLFGGAEGKREDSDENSDSDCETHIRFPAALKGLSNF